MLDITVKTLDSQNHSFNCEDDITVRGFKEHIAETVSVAVESQRLIYCGRVLQDDKKLNDYDVNGKVIHLVQRAPPQPGSRSSSTDRQQRSTTQGHWTLGTPRVQFSRGLHRNVYMGAMAVPTEVVENHGLPAPQLSNTLSNSRLITARCMLNKVTRLMDRMDDPSVPLHPSPTESTTSESTQPQPSAPEEDQLEREAESFGERAMQISSDIAAAFSDIADAAGASLFNVRVSGEDNSEDGTSTSSNSATSTSQPAESESREQMQQDLPCSQDSEPQPSEPQQEQQEQSQQSERPESERPNTSRSNDNESATGATRRAPVPRPPQMAELLDTLLTTQDRLKPYIERYRSLMSTDPTLSAEGTGPESVAENQRIVDGVSESLHFLSHACHALSDIIVDMGQQPPRNLRCRPIIIQHSTILQAGIPIPVETHINLNRNNNNNTTSATTANTATTESGSEPRRPSSPSQSGPNQRANNDRQNTQRQSHPNIPSMHNLLGTLLLPSNVEVSMELSPPTALDLSPRATEGSENNQGQSINNNNNTNGVTIEGAGSLNATPLALIREAIRSVINERQSLGGEASTTINLPLVMDLSTNSGQSTQARSNIGTHPTTSTQTRSTARPHVLHPQAHPLNMGMDMGHNLDFDPFLPCYSHHVRRTPPNSASSTATRSNRRNQTSTAERRSRSQSASRSSSSARTMPHVNFTVGGDLNVTRDFLENDTQALASGLAMTLGEILQGATNSGDVHISVIGGPNTGPLHIPSRSNDIPLLELLRSFNIQTDDFGSSENRTFLHELWIFLLRHFTASSIIQLGMGQSEPLISIRRPLREFLEQQFPNERGAELQNKIVDEIVNQIITLNQPYLQLLGTSQDESASRRVDIPATISVLLRLFFKDFFEVLFSNETDEAYAARIKIIARRFEEHTSAVLQHILGGREQLESIVSRIFSQMTEGTNIFFQQFMVELLSARLRSFTTRRERSSDELSNLLVFVDEPSTTTPVEAERSSKKPEMGTFRVPVSPSKRQQKGALKDDQQGPSSRTECEPEATPMEVDRPEIDLQLLKEVENDSQDLSNGEEVPEMFPGAESLPSDWVPIIARDTVRQRRHQLNNPIPFSDAYLSCMPSKRRKLIKQQKPQLLVTPTPANANAIAASVEKLVRDGMVYSQVEEVEGAAHAVAAVPEVRTAFGQAIRDCLGPNILQTPDFPNPRRFPMASRLFAEAERVED